MIYDAVGIVLVNKNGEILMQHRYSKLHAFYKDFWCYIGGGVEDGEDFELAPKENYKKRLIM